LTLTHGKTVFREVTVFRQPGQWEPRFTRWASLGERFTPLQRVLSNSPGLRVRGGPTYELFSASTYDSVESGDRTAMRAKAAMLNLFAKLTQLTEPVMKRKPWFGFVTRLLEISSERFIALVDEEMAIRARAILDDRPTYGDRYHPSAAGNHHGNLPARFQVPKTRMFSLKTNEKLGNVQLTFGPGIDPETAKPVWLLDTDIDENGRMLQHLGDIFKHKFTGGTDPLDIHEYLLLTYRNIDLGYSLV
jgi:hypothetical protein